MALLSPIHVRPGRWDARSVTMHHASKPASDSPTQPSNFVGPLSNVGRIPSKLGGTRPHVGRTRLERGSNPPRTRPEPIKFACSDVLVGLRALALGGASSAMLVLQSAAKENSHVAPHARDEIGRRMHFLGIGL